MLPSAHAPGPSHARAETGDTTAPGRRWSLRSGANDRQRLTPRPPQEVTCTSSATDVSAHMTRPAPDTGSTHSVKPSRRRPARRGVRRPHRSAAKAGRDSPSAVRTGLRWPTAAPENRQADPQTDDSARAHPRGAGMLRRRPPAARKPAPRAASRIAARGASRTKLRSRPSRGFLLQPAHAPQHPRSRARRAHLRPPES